MLSNPRTNELIGIVGGLGPLASAEFLKSIYENSLVQREQDTPKVIMYSDPSFPDRTEAILSRQQDHLFEKLVRSLRALSSLGATRTVICCVTAHCLFHSLPAELKTGLISLLDVIFERLRQSPEKRLLICSNGTRESCLFQEHELWPATKEYFVLPDARDQDFLHHELIYQVKKNRDVNEMLPALKNLLAKYKVNGFIAGCTETHIVAKRFVSGGGRGCIDPLSILAERIGAGTL